MKSRQRKKLINKSIVIMDINAIPKYLYMEQWLEAIKVFGIVLYDSRYNGEIPKIYPKINIKAFKLIDKNKE